MLELVVPAREMWDETDEIFITSKETTLRLEHSLVSISKWEAKWCIPFLKDNNKTTKQMLDYIRCMTLTQNVDPIVYKCLTKDNFDTINGYINYPMTATKIKDDPNTPHSRKILTSEVIYYQMIAFGIPFECQKWHLNRLLTLIRVCSEESKPKKKMSQAAIMRQNAALNAARHKSHRR